MEGYPTFSLLSYQKGFRIEDAVLFAKKKKHVNIFFVFPGQQGVFTMRNRALGISGRADAEADVIFCRDMTGGKRIARGKTWKGRYRIHTSKHPEDMSVASRLFDRYHENSIIIDVLNLKFNWEFTDRQNRAILDYMSDIFMNQIYKKIREHTTVSIMFLGFSRGGVFSLLFADRIK